MTACYGVAVWLAERLRPRFVVAVVVAVYAIFLLSPPLLLTDVFNYIEYARMGVVHGLNPYTHLPVHVVHDPVRGLSNWHHLPSPYGPLFTLITYALAPLGVAGAYWGYKVLLFAASLGCLWLVGAIARRLGRPVMAAVVLVGLNPLVLLYGAGGQHNDMFTLLPILAGLYLLMARREVMACAGFVAAAATKASAVVLLPVAIAAGPRRGAVARRRRRGRCRARRRFSAGLRAAPARHPRPEPAGDRLQHAQRRRLRARPGR